MNKKEKSILLAFAFFCFNWFIAQYIGGYIGSIMFATLYTTVSGIALPIVLIKKYEIPTSFKNKLLFKIAGIIFLITFTIFSIIPSGALNEVIAKNPSMEVLIKYVILFLPMSFGITVFCFYLIPHIIDENISNKYLKNIIIIMTSGLTCGFGFWIDTLGNIEMFTIMGMLGIFFGISYILTRSLYYIWIAFFTSMMFHTLGEGKYYNYEWSILIVEIVCIIFVYFILKMIRK